MRGKKKNKERRKIVGNKCRKIKNNGMGSQ